MPSAAAVVRASNLSVRNIDVAGALSEPIFIEMVSEKDPEHAMPLWTFPAVKVSFGKLPTFLVFGTGKFVAVGGVSINQIRERLGDLKRLLRRAGYRDVKASWSIQNIVCSGELPHRIDMTKISLIQERDPEVKYDPSVFPGARFYGSPEREGPTVLLFESGKLIVNGINTERVGDGVALARKSAEAAVRKLMKYRALLPKGV